MPAQLSLLPKFVSESESNLRSTFEASLTAAYAVHLKSSLQKNEMHRTCSRARFPSAPYLVPECMQPALMVLAVHCSTAISTKE